LTNCFPTSSEQRGSRFQQPLTVRWKRRQPSGLIRLKILETKCKLFCYINSSHCKSNLCGLQHARDLFLLIANQSTVECFYLNSLLDNRQSIHWPSNFSFSTLPSTQLTLATIGEWGSGWGRNHTIASELAKTERTEFSRYCDK
jgi:hypothetical protein